MAKMFYQENEEFYNHILLQEKEKEYNYLDWKKCSEVIGTKVNRRETILVLSQNCSGTLLGILSFLRNNLVSLLIDAALPKKQIENTIHLYQPNYIYVSKEKEGEYSGFSTLLEIEGMVLLKNEIMIEPVKNDDLAILMSTSGSTGSPKFVRLSFSSLENDANYINDTVGASKEDGCITVLPLHFLYCLESVFRHVKVGARIIMTNDSVVKNEFWKLCERYKPNYFFGVPYVYETIYKLGIQSYLEQFKTMSISGGKPSLVLIEQMNAVALKSNGQFFVEYGQTEAGGMLTIDIKAKDGESKVTADIGVPHPNCNIALHDAEDNEITGYKTEGELIYTGGNVYMGYANGYEDLSKSNEIHSVLKTGDIGIRYEDGTIHIVGRITRFIKIYGKRFSLDYMETEMKAEMKQPGIALVGMDELLMVYCTNEESVKEIKDYIHKEYKLSVKNYSVNYIKEFPLKSNGKIDYTALMKLSDCETHKG